jgi:hypothetical protein
MFGGGGPMAFEELYLVSTRVVPVDGRAVEDLLSECGIDPPGGYREFLTRFGLGEICGFLSTQAPNDIRAWRREIGGLMLDEGLYDVAAEQWAACGVTFEQFHRGVELWATNQRPSFLAVPGHGPRAFQWEVGEVVCYERGMIDMIPAVARLMFDASFPFFEPQRPDRKHATYAPRPGLAVEAFVSAVFDRWGAGVRRLRSGEDDYALSVFSRPVQAQFTCYREESSEPERLTTIGVTYDVEEEGELLDFLRGFFADLDR